MSLLNLFRYRDDRRGRQLQVVSHIVWWKAPLSPVDITEHLNQPHSLRGSAIAVDMCAESQFQAAVATLGVIIVDALQ